MVKRRTKPRIPQPPAIMYVNFTSQKGRGKSEANRYAIFSAAVYQANPDAYLKQFKKISWKRDNSLSNKNTSTFVNSQTGKVIISFRGTDWGKISDIWQNFGILTGSSLFRQRLKSNLKLFDKVAKKYGKQNITLTGHSAGGFQATEVAMDKKVHAVVFNAANNGSMKEVLKAAKAKGLVKAYTTTSWGKLDVDVVSLLNPHPNETIAKKKGLDAHTIDNFLPNPEDAIGEGIMGDIGRFLRDEAKALMKTAQKEGTKFVKKEAKKLKKKAGDKIKKEGTKLYEKGKKKVIKEGKKVGKKALKKITGSGVDKIYCKKCDRYISKSHWQRHIKSKVHNK